MWLSQPTHRQLDDIYNLQARIAPRRIVQYFLCVIRRTVVYRHNFQCGVINLSQRFERACNKLGLNRNRIELNLAKFRRPTPDSAQASLF